jgi:hypothetical protein
MDDSRAELLSQINATILDPDRFANLKQLFESTDSTHSGAIGANELSLVLQRAGLSLSDEQTKLTTKLFEHSADSSLDYIEFLAQSSIREFTAADLATPTSMNRSLTIKLPKSNEHMIEVRRQSVLIDVSHAVKRKGVQVADPNIALKMQGNLQHYSLSAMKKRDAVKRHQFIKEEIGTFWNSIDMIKVTVLLE